MTISELCLNPSYDLQELVSAYNNTLMAALDKHAPLMTRTIVQRPRVPWFSQEIREAKRQRTKAVKRWRKSRLDSDLAVFKAKRPVLWTTYPSYGQGSEGVLQKLYKRK